MRKLSLNQIQKHIKLNSDNTYSLAVEVASLYMRLYGELPKIGLSGAQAEYAKQFAKRLPEAL